jgi:N-acyl-D-aspartate/D-glutamate deacylase
VDEPARRTLDADGLWVTPGWVDVHTHYDGQVTWDSLLTPSCWHGVTTVVMGNCGLGVAPIKPERRDVPLPIRLSSPCARLPMSRWPRNTAAR